MEEHGYTTPPRHGAATSSPDHPHPHPDQQHKNNDDSSDCQFDKLAAGNSVDIAAPHKLTEDEASELRRLMKGELNIVDEEEDDDADTFLEYALDLIDRGETAKQVMEEVGIDCSKKKLICPCVSFFIYNSCIFHYSTSS